MMTIHSYEENKQLFYFRHFMKIAISGASGFVGKQLVRLLNLDSHEIIVIGRNKKKLADIFPELEVSDYEEMEEKISNCEIFINLTTINNNENQNLESFNSVNLDLSLWILKIAHDAKIKKVINFSSIHCLDKRRNDFYTSSKRDLLNALKRDNLNVISLLLPTVYGEKFTGKLFLLNYLPNIIRQTIFPFIKSIKTTVNINLIHKLIINIDEAKYPIKIICSDNQNDNFFYRLWNKFIDISFATSILFLFWWMLLLIAILIRLSSKGDALYRQTRLGKNKKRFLCYKFRTMFVDTPELPTHEIGVSSVTKLGKFLRKYKLDELPQIFNIIKGEMSLIGPRPCLESQDTLVKARSLKNIFDSKPGITGLGAIQNIAMDTPIKLSELDEQYYKTRSISLDLFIIIKTFFGYGFNDKTQK